MEENIFNQRQRGASKIRCAEDPFGAHRGVRFGRKENIAYCNDLPVEKAIVGERGRAK